MLATTQIDSTGNYEFTAVLPCYYNINATKHGYWPDSNPVTVNASEPATADIVLCQKGDFNTNSEPADAGDLVIMADTTAAGTSDETYDLDGDGDPANENDLTLLKDVSVGVAELE
ncbi:Carboxypeptidase regulatory-like domain-containing protein [Candidatus Methanophagaceae archaeon]|nr:Carboxypeptidase regulatory-like domain-containing protein [Methanophagales archaeon]